MAGSGAHACQALSTRGFWAAVAACGGEIGIIHVVSTYRRRGSAAFFAPYIAALPPQPPCPWLLPPAELDAAFAKLGAAEAAVLLCCTCSHGSAECGGSLGSARHCA